MLLLKLPVDQFKFKMRMVKSGWKENLSIPSLLSEPVNHPGPEADSLIMLTALTVLHGKLSKEITELVLIVS